MGSARGGRKGATGLPAPLLRHLHRLYPVRFGTPVRVARFLAVGGSGFVVDVAGYLGLQGLGLEQQAGTTNRRLWRWRRRERNPPWRGGRRNRRPGRLGLMVEQSGSVD